MGKFEIEGYAKRKVRCDIAIVHVTFRAIGVNAAELSKKVMDECDDFIQKLGKLSIKPQDIQYASDRTTTNSYQNKTELEATREICIRMPFDLRVINHIQGALMHGKYNYTMYVDGDISNRHEVLAELSQEALSNSRDIADKLAASTGMEVKSIESVRKDRWDDEEDRSMRCGDAGAGYGAGDIFGDIYGDLYGKRASDEIEAKYIEEDVRLKVTWNIA